MASSSSRKQGTFRSAALNRLTWFPGISKAAKSLMGSALPALPPQNGDHFIRLLSLKPGHDGVVSCSVSVHALRDAPEFYALSYVWGTDQELHWIACNGHPVSLRSNLYKALLQLRQTEFTTLWIDAICIDQSNVAERNHQVQLMGKIYSSAVMTVVWLGSAQPHDDRTLEYVRKLSKAWQAHSDHVNVRSKGFHLYGQDLVDLGLPAWKDHHEPLLEPLSDLFISAWYSRAWVLQEFVLAKAVTLLQGQVRFDWLQLTEAYFMLCTISSWYAYNSPEHYRHDTMATIRCELTAATRNGAGPIVQHFSARCSDPRDKVFSLLGIYETTDHQLFANHAIQPDYESTVEDVYTGFVSYVLRTTECLDVLLFLPRSHTVRRRLPSWVADFSISDQYPHLYLRASNQAWSAASYSVVKVNGRTLGLQGYELDEIVEVSDFVADHSLLTSKKLLFKGSSSALVVLSSVLRSRRNTCPRDGSYVDGKPRSDAFWRTIFMLPDTDHVVRQACDSDRWTSWETFIIDAAESPDAIDRRIVQPDDEDYSSTDVFFGTCTVKDMIDHWKLHDNLKMARTKLGYYCKVSEGTEAGDSVLLCAGGKTPFTARRFEDGELDEPRWMLLGGCYVDGVMHGEAWEPEKAKEMWFE